MNYVYRKVAACLCVILTCAWTTAISSIPAFVDCNNEPIQLCVQDAGVRLPANNKFFLGENHPDATSCSVHVSRQISVQTNCPGELTYEVNIYLFESADPVLLQVATSVTPDSLLTAVLSFDTETATDDVIKSNGISYTTGCARYHRIVWTVTDACGESSECEMYIDVYDCATPIHSSNALQFLNSTVVGYIDLQLSDFNIPSSDDCSSSGDYLYSFLPDSHVPDSLFHVCDFNTWGVEIEYPIWIADAGRDLNCDSLIEWRERQILEHFIHVVIVGTALLDCDPDTIDCYFLSSVTDLPGSGIKNVTMTLHSPAYSSTFMTDSDGKVGPYFFIGPSLNIDISKTDFHKNGVSTLDNVVIMKHLLGIQPIINPYKFIAADVNNSYGVSAVDLLINRKIILGTMDEYPGGQSWKFVRKNYSFPDITFPWTGLINQDTFYQCQNHALDYIGIKLGDLNNTAQPNALSLIPRNDYPVIHWKVDQKNYKKGEEFEIPVYAGNLKSMQGFQLTFSAPDLEFLDVHSTIIDLEESFALFGNQLTMAWVDLSAPNTQEDDILFTIRAKALKDGNIKESLSLNSDITKAELYTSDEEIFIPQLMIRPEHHECFSTPNPWSVKTTIPFNLDQSNHVKLDIMDLTGRLLFTASDNFLKGDNQFEISSSDVNDKGLLIYVITSGNEMIRGQMVKM